MLFGTEVNLTTVTCTARMHHHHEEYKESRIRKGQTQSQVGQQECGAYVS